MSLRPSGRTRALLYALLSACVPLGLGASGALADTTTTINFENPRIPGTASPQAGEAVSTQYLSEGVEFTSPPASIKEPLGWSPYANAQPDLYRDDTNAPAGDNDHQVLYAHVCFSEGCSFNEYASEMFGRLTTSTTQVELYAGVQGGGPVELAGYNIEGKVVADETENAKTKDETLLKITAAKAEIAYFSVASVHSEFALEVGDLKFVVPAVPPPPAIVLEQPALPNGPVGSQGTSVSLGVGVQRFNDADEEIKLEVSGLPSGVTLTGGETIAAGSNTTELTFSISPSAPLVSEAPFRISATSHDVKEPPAPITEDFYIESPLQVKLLNYSSGTYSGSHTVALTPCSSSVQEVAVMPGPGVSTPTSLALSAAGDTGGLSYTLAKTTVPSSVGEVNLSISEASSGGTGEAEITVTGTNASHPASSATVVVNRVAGAITSVTPLGVGPVFGLPLAPQFLSGGTQVRVSGSGLCPGSTVQFGNEKATVTPSAVEPDGESLTAAVPLYATTGPVTVHTPAGNLVSPHSLEVDSFRDTWGWPFSNYSLKESSVTYEVASTLFGYENVYVSTPFGNVPSPAAIVWNFEAKSMAGKGVCFGMATLIQWLSNEGSFELFGELNNYPHTGLTPHQLAGPAGPSAALENMIAVFHLDQLSGQFQEYQGEEMDESNPISPQRTVEAVRSAIAGAGGGDLPVISLQNQGPKGGGHAVVAYNIESDGAGGYYIDVYNPNTPYTPGEESDTSGKSHEREVEESRIHVNANGSWTFADGFEPTWEGNAYHMFPVPWGRVPNPFAFAPGEKPEFGFRRPVGIAAGGWNDPLAQLSDPLAQAGNPLAWAGEATRAGDAVDASSHNKVRPGLPSASKLLGVTSSGSAGSLAQVSDAAGHTLIAPDGSENVNPKTRIPHAALVFPATGSATPGPPTALLPAGGSYTVTERGAGAGTYTETLMGGGLDALVSSSAKPGVDDRIGVAPDAGRISFASGAGAKPLTIEMTSDPGGSSHSVTLTTTSVHGGAGSLSFRGGSVRYSHSGPASTVTLELSTVSSSGLPVALSTGPVQIGAGQSATFTPTSWSALGAVAATISGHGAHSTLLLRNRLRPPAPVRSLALGVRRGAGRTRVLTIKDRLGRLPGGAQLELVWTVKRGARTLERHVLTLTGGQLRPGAHSESLTFTAPAAGRYSFTGRATLIVTHGVVEQGASTARSVGLTV